jgi:energy-coupling factor transporter ATP-binding protein EcfA2
MTDRMSEGMQAGQGLNVVPRQRTGSGPAHRLDTTPRHRSGATAPEEHPVPDHDPHRTGWVDGDSLVARAEALDRFVRAAAGALPADRLAGARALAERTRQRLARSREHTVVALAGTTGSGKSSLFNTLSGLTLSDVGVRRPTTGHVHACVWGGVGADELLDWLEVPAQLRFTRESPLDAEDEAPMRGLILLDLPDLDSLVAAHRTEADRLLELVDLVVWVTDPQKYADRVVHESYLRTFQRHREITVVVLNQTDRLLTADIGRCTADLRRLLEADGLTGVPVLPTTAVQGPVGALRLRIELEKAVTARQAQLRKLDGDLDELVGELSGTIGPAAAAVDRGMLRGLVEALCTAAGAEAVANAVARAYRYRARRAMGWPLTRYRRPRPEPSAEPGPTRPIRSSALTVPARAQPAAVDLAVRGLAERAGAGLPEPWVAAVDAAARSRMAELPGLLDFAIDHVDLEPEDTPPWWRLVEVLQWLLVLTAAGGVAGLVARPFLSGLGPADRPALVGGAALLAGWLVSLLVTPLTKVGSRRAYRSARGPLESAVTDIASEHVVRPVREVVGRYGEAREALGWARR